MKRRFSPRATSERAAALAVLLSAYLSAAEDGVGTSEFASLKSRAAVWLAGTEGAIMLAMDSPEAFGQLIETIALTDLARTELAAAHPGVDLIVQRGWYSSTDFWSPTLFDEYVFPHVRTLAAVAHRHGKKFAYVMTTGVATLGPRLADARVDLLYFVDPVQDDIALEQARDLLAARMAVAGGVNALDLAGEHADIAAKTRRALDVLGPTNHFILHPVDALFPDTPWAGVRAMIDAWERTR